MKKYTGWLFFLPVILSGFLVVSGFRNVPLKKEVQQPLTSNSDTLKTPCVIFISPTGIQLDTMKKVLGEERYYPVMDEQLYHMEMARIYADSVQIPIVETRSDATPLIFKHPNGNLLNMDISQVYWGIILFNGKDFPVEVEITQFARECKKYMQPAE